MHTCMHKKYMTTYMKIIYMKINTKKLKQYFYDIWPGNGEGLFSKENISKGGDKEK